MAEALEAIGGEEEGGVTGAIGQIFSGVVITMLIAVGITVILLFLANVTTGLGIFPEGSNPFVLIYNAVRNLTLFIMLFPIFLPLLVTAFVLDLVVDIGFPIIDGILDIWDVTAGINMPDPADINISKIATDLTTAIQDLVVSLFPPLEI